MKKRFSLFVMLLLLGIGQMWGYTFYLYTGSFPDWHSNGSETFKMWTNTDVTGKSIGSYWYKFDVGTYEGTAYIKRCSSTGDKWNEFSGDISSTNNLGVTTGWDDGIITTMNFYLVGKWNGVDNWDNTSDANKMTWNPLTETFTTTLNDVSGSVNQEFKITTYNSWDISWAYSSYDATSSKNVVNVSEGNNSNIVFQPAMLQGTVTITYLTSTNKVSVVCQTPVVTFKKYDGIYGNNTQNAEYGQAAAKIEVPKKDNYDFGGYYEGVNGTGTQVIDASGAWLKSVDGYTDATPKWVIRTDTTLYAKWTGKAYAITYKDKGDVAYSGSNAASLPATYTYGEGINPLPNGAKDDYTFDGWFSTPACDGDPVTAISASASGAMTLYAKWTEIVGGSVQLTAGEGGQVSKDNTNWNTSATITDIKANQEVNIYAKANTGYSFEAWTKTSGTGSIKTNEAAGVYNAVAYSAEAVKASFTENKVAINPTVHFDAGTAAYTATATVANIGIETSSVLTASAATTGFTFAGWTLSDNLVVLSGNPAKDLSITVRTNGDGAAVTAQANYNEDLKTNYVLCGGAAFGGTAWKQNLPLVKKTGHSAESVGYLTVNIAAAVGSEADETYNFKIVEGTTWWGLEGDGDYWFLRATTEQTMKDGQNIQLRADKVGAYEIKVDYSGASPKISITFPTFVKSFVTLTGPEHGELVVKNGADTVKSGTEVTEQVELTVEAKSTNPAYYIKSLHAYKGDNIKDTVKIIDGKLTMPAATLTVIATEEVRTLQIAGAWDTYKEEEVTKWKANTMTPSEDKKTATYEVELEKGEYEFKLINNGNWITKENDGAYGLHRTWPGVAGVKDDAANNLKVTVDKDGLHTFTWTYANDSLGINFPDLIKKAITYAAPENGTLTVKDGDKIVATGTEVNENTVLTIEAGANTGYYLTGVKAYKTGNKETVVTITDNKITMPTYEVTIEATVAEEFYSIAGDISLMGSDWDLTDANNKMTKQSDGSYKLVKEKVELPASASTVYQYKLGHNGAYLLPAEGNYQLTNIKRSGEYTLTFTYKNNAVTLDTVCTTPKSIVSKIYIGGDFTNWNENPIELAVGEYELTASKKIALTEGVHEFKVLAPTWKGKAATEIKRPANDSAIIDMSTETTEDNIKLYVDVAGDYNFIWTYATSKLTIVYPEAPAVKPAWLFIGYVDGEGEHWQPIQVMTKAGNGKTASIALDLEEKEYQLKMIVDSKWVTKNDGDNMYGLKRDWPGVADVKDAEGKNMKLTADWPGEYTFTWTYQNDSLGITFPAEPAITYNLAGNFTSAGEAWDEMKEMINDEGVWSIAIDLAAKTDYVFKIVRKQGNKKEWYGLESTAKMVYGNCTDWVIGGGDANIGLTTTTEYSYTFKFVPEGMKLSVVIPKETTAIEGIEAGEKAVKVMMDGQLIILKDGKMYNVMGALIR